MELIEPTYNDFAGRNGCLVEFRNENEVSGTVSVSYTHLDVYKRQQ